MICSIHMLSIALLSASVISADTEIGHSSSGMDALLIAAARPEHAAAGVLEPQSGEHDNSVSMDYHPVEAKRALYLPDTSVRIAMLTRHARVLAASTNARSSRAQHVRALQQMEPLLLELQGLRSAIRAEEVTDSRSDADFAGETSRQSALTTAMLLQSQAQSSSSSEFAPILKTGAAIGKSLVGAMKRATSVPTGSSCFACLYMMQRAVADSSPYYTA